jgi:integrase
MRTTAQRRRQRGAAWHWKQTDGWYYTPPGTKRRIPLTDEDGRRIRGQEHRQAAELALARVKLAGNWRPTSDAVAESQWLVAGICSHYIDYCDRAVARSAMSKEYRDAVAHYLNELCNYCGALPVAELKKGHVLHWVELHPTWRSPVTRRNAIAIVLAAFNHAQAHHDVLSPLRGLKKPPPRPRLHSFTREDEAAIYGATDKPFADFLFAAIHTGLRPFCELARLTPEDIVETNRGMMWRVYSTKTKKTRKIPVRLEVAQLTRRLLSSAPPLNAPHTVFRNAQGRPWKKVTGVGRFLKIKNVLGWDQDPVKGRYSCYTCRHTFAHRMLAGYWNGGAGCSIETLAELLGDTPKVAFDHYGREWGQHFQEPLWAAIGVGESGQR